MIIVVIMLLSMLIAMMAQTFKTISTTAFNYYSFAFAKVLVAQRCQPGSIAVPLNLVSMPYHVLRFLRLLFRGATKLGKQPHPKQQASCTRRDSERDFAEDKSRASDASAKLKRWGTSGNLRRLTKAEMKRNAIIDGRDPEVRHRRHTQSSHPNSNTSTAPRPPLVAR